MVYSMTIKNKNNGFSLIELAMVLFILSLMMGSFLTPLATSLEQRDREKTNELLEEVRESLIGYALVNGHLPCPDCPNNATGNCGIVETAMAPNNPINNGIEDGTDGPGVATGYETRSIANTFDQCATAVGNLPWVTLDVPENDAWGNHFIYGVMDEFADDTDGTGMGLPTPTCSNPAVGVSFCLDSADDAIITINDANNVSVATNVPVLVVSTGNSTVDFANLTVAQIAALSDAEKENLDGLADSLFIANDYIKTDGAAFDDMLMWISPSLLMYQMVRAERLP
jgi:prepilin-type N-terminal cleavage/methylation domain-containing protein